MAEFDKLKNVLYKYYQENKHLGKNQIFKKFCDVDAPRSTLYHLLNLLEQKNLLI